MQPPQIRVNFFISSPIKKKNTTVRRKATRSKSQAAHQDSTKDDIFNFINLIANLEEIKETQMVKSVKHNYKRTRISSQSKNIRKGQLKA